MLSVTKNYLNFYEEFHKTFDQSVVETALRNYTNNNNELSYPYQKIGEGYHQDVYAYKAAPNVLSVCKRSLDPKTAKTGDFLQWLQDIRSIEKKCIEGIPPFKLVCCNNVYALYMPRGQHYPNNAATTELGKALQQKLLKLGIEFQDGLQILHYQGLPFVCDLSDLYLPKKRTLGETRLRLPQ